MAKAAPRTLADIEQQIESLRKEAAAVRAREVAEVVQKIKVAIDTYGLTAEDLGLARKRRVAKPAGATRGAARRAGGRGKGARPVKYRDAAGHEWVGHGKRPAWFVAALASGMKPEDLLVK